MTQFYTIDDAVRKVGMGRFQHFVLFLAGMGWFADACEVLIQSVLGMYLACEWTMYHWNSSLLTSIVFAGMMIGCPIFGAAADIYGRRISLLVSMVMLFVFGAVSAASPSYTWMVVFRGITGFAMGGIGQGLTLCAEYMPPKSRGKGGYYLAFYWSVGTVAITLANWAVMATLNDWRVLLLVTAIPAFVVLLSLRWYPESARFYLISDQYDKALATLEKMAKMNRKELPEGTLIHVDTVESRGRVQDLFRPQFRVTTSLFCVMWFSICFSYYGMAFLSPSLIKVGNVYDVVSEMNSTQTDVVPCKILTQDKYVDMVWTSSSEIPGLIVFTILVDRMQRKTLVVYSCIISGISIFLILIRTNLRWLINLFQFVSRAITISVFQLIYIMTSEVFPTPVRAVAIGLGTAFARLGGLTVPFVSQMLFSIFPIAAVCILGVASWITAAAAFFLPIEKSGGDMRETWDWSDEKLRQAGSNENMEHISPVEEKGTDLAKSVKSDISKKSEIQKSVEK